MTRAINESYDFQAFQAHSSLLELRLIFKDETAALYGGTKLYRLAVARRYSVVYFSFLTYLLSRLNIDGEKETIGMEQIISRCRRYNLLTIDDERMVMQMSMLYTTLSYYNQGFDGTNDDLIQDIPRMCDFVENFIGLKTILPMNVMRLEATV
jgi:hypothetical protein